MAGLNAIFISLPLPTTNSNTNNSISTSYLLRGRESGYNATFICSNYNTCDIECRSDACNHVRLMCGSINYGIVTNQILYDVDSDNNLCTWNIRCWYSFRSHLCSNTVADYDLRDYGYNYSKIPSLIDLPMSDTEILYKTI